jgi:hypothetical protein
MEQKSEERACFRWQIACQGALKHPRTLTTASATSSVSSPWAHATYTTCIQRNFDVCAPALRSQPAHTTRHNFGYTNSHTATKTLACGSWRCSSLCTHPRSPLLTGLGYTCASALALAPCRLAPPPHTHNAITLATLTPTRPLN